MHWSDCAVHNAPASKPGPCDCAGFKLEELAAKQMEDARALTSHPQNDERIAAALEQIKAGIADFCRTHPEQDIVAMINMAENTLRLKTAKKQPNAQ